MRQETIVYFGGFELPDKNAAAQRVISISKSLRDAGYRVVLVGLSKELSEEDGIVECNCNIHGLEMRERAYPRNIKQWINHIATCKSEIEFLKKDITVKAVICYNYPALALWNLNKFCISKKMKLIADVTEWYPPSNKGFPFNIIKDIDTKVRMSWVHPKLCYVICISKYLYEYYKNKVPNCVLIPGTIDTADEKWMKTIEYVPNDPFTLGYAGDPGVKCEKERIDLLISAVCQLNAEGYSCRLKLAGFDPVLFELQYPQISKHTHYKECIHSLGRLSHQECLHLISSVDYSVIIRGDTRVTRAGFPTKLSESFACGTPVITTPSSNIADFIIEGKNGFITKDFSYEAVLEMIRTALSDKSNNLVDIHRFVRKNNNLKYENYTEAIAKFIEHSTY